MTHARTNLEGGFRQAVRSGMTVPFYLHQMGAEDAAKIAAVLDTPFLTSGQVGRDVEAQLSVYFDAPHALLTNSWTNGALATLLAMDIGQGDEVIVPAMTFIATANVVELLGAKPVFADVDPDTLCLTPETVAPHVNDRTRAVIPVHLYGQMADIAALRASLRSDIRIIEDAAHCFEGLLNGAHPGTHSDAAIFSFYATKNITCGEGGAIVTQDSQLFAKLQATRLHGMSAGAADRYRGATYNHWDMMRLGVKANLPDLLAALLPHQIAAADEKLKLREAIAARYEAAFAKDERIQLQAPVEGGRHARHLFPIGVAADKRDAMIVKLNADGIGCTVNYRSVPTLTFYRERYGFAPGFAPVSEAWGDATISLPLYPTLSEEAQGQVIEAVNRTLNAMETEAA